MVALMKLLRFNMSEKVGYREGRVLSLEVIQSMVAVLSSIMKVFKSLVERLIHWLSMDFTTDSKRVRILLSAGMKISWKEGS